MRPPARALTPSLVPQEILVSALAQRSVAFQLAVVAGPALGGVLFAIQPELVYAVGLGLSLVALGCVLALRSGREPAAEGAAGLDERPRRRSAHPADAACCSARSRSISSRCSSAARSRCCRSSRRTSSRSGRPASGSCAPRRRRARSLAALFLARYPIRRRAGRTLFLVVAGFGACMVVFGLSREMWLSMLALALGAAFDLVSVVLRSTILPLVTPDELRGRVNAVEMVFISASNELGAFESGVAAALIGAVPAVVVGGVATIVVAGVWWRLFPALARVDRLDELEPVRRRARLSRLPARTFLIDASTSSIGWSAGSGRPRRPSACETWTRQPGFALA